MRLFHRSLPADQALRRAPADLAEVLELLERYSVAADKVWLMPEGSAREQLETRRHWLVDICKTYGFYYSDRLHVQIWGSKKGV